MEKILRQFSYLSNEQFGLICKLAFLYIDDLELPEDVDRKTKVFFNLNVKPLLDYMLKQRKRTKKNYERKVINNGR